jgi:L-amino acid N-acyltransferase YncA
MHSTMISKRHSTSTGTKFGRWLDLVLMQRVLD